MKLGVNQLISTQLNDQDLKMAILERRNVIRYHRDQLGDDRCWVDDYLVCKMLDDTPPEPTQPPEFEVAMQECKDFYKYRRADTPDPVPKNAVVEKDQWDKDLDSLSHDALEQELLRLQQAIQTHRDSKEDRVLTLEDDRELYKVLPEHMPADFRLPPEDDFIGGINPCSGCPNFWKSHFKCATKKHNLHQWGPCEKN